MIASFKSCLWQDKLSASVYIYSIGQFSQSTTMHSIKAKPEDATFGITKLTFGQFAPLSNVYFMITVQYVKTSN